MITAPIWLGVWFGAGPGFGLALQAPPPRPELMYVVERRARISIRVDTTALDGGNEGLENKITERVSEQFTKLGIEVGEDPLALVVVIDRNSDVEHPIIGVNIWLERDGERIPNSERRAECKLCTYSEVVEAAWVLQLEIIDLARANQAVPEPVAEDTEPTDEPVDVDPVDPRKIGPLGYAGIGVAVLGIAGIGAGAGLAVKGIELIPPTFEEQRDFSTPGYVVLGIGSAALVSGIVMIVLDVNKRKHANRERAAVRAHASGFAF